MVSVRGNQPNNKVTASSSTSTNNKAEVKPITINNQVEATNNLAKYYSEISRDWAEGEGLIQNIDYSSKTYALQAKDSATEAKASLDEAKGYTSDAVEEIQQLEQAVLSNISMLEQSASSTVEQGIQNIGETVEEALEDLETASGEIMETVEANSRALPMFSPIWSDHILHDVSYLRADTFSWHSGYIYKTAYEVLLNEYNNENCVEEVENGITYRRTPSGFKIASVEQNDVILDVYNNTGIAWYYIIDVVNMQFKLPRTQWGFVGNRDGVGGQIEAGLPSVVHTHTFSATTSSAGAHIHNITLGYAAGANWGRTGAKWGGDDVTDSKTATGTTASAGAHTHTVSGTTGGANITSNIYGKSDTVQPPATQMYLYFYIGNYQRPATEIQTGKVFDVLANKADIDGGNYVGSGLEKRIDNTLDEFLTDNKDSFLNKSQITNCLLEVPQRIKYDLTDGTLTVKAGTVVIVPYGTEDKTSELPVGATFLNENFKVYDTQYAEDAEGNGKFFVWAEVQNDIISSATTTTDTLERLVEIRLTTNSFQAVVNTISGTTAFTGTGNCTNYRTDLNIVQIYEAGVLEDIITTLPLLKVKANGTNFYGSVLQVFNGIGYIGSTICVDKGVKGLIPNKRNEDGSLRNIEWTNDKIRTTGADATGNFYVAYQLDIDNFGIKASASWVFDENENMFVYKNGTEHTLLILSNVTLDAGVITSLNPKQPFRAVDYSDYVNTPHIIQTYVSGTSWYRVWSDGWIEQGGQVNVAANTTGTVTLLKTMSNTNYFLTGTNISYYHKDDWSVTPYMKRVSTSQIQLGNFWDAQVTFCWMVCGY